MLKSEIDPELNEVTVPDEILPEAEEINTMESGLNYEHKELLELRDKYIRLAAEFDNYRKRTLRERMELIQNAGESLLRDLLPLADDFERGIEQASEAEDMDAVRAGMDLIYNKLKDFLTNHGIKEISAINEPFDTNWHEAIVNISVPLDEMKGKIVDVIQKGYTLNDKILRYAKVVVGE